MAYLLTLTFSAPLNASCQVGDTAYYATTAEIGGFKSGKTPVKIGQIREISGTTNDPVVKCITNLGAQSVHGQTKFILFSKDNKANLSSVLGYYAEVKLVNDSTAASELFSIAMDTFESSK
jgi:hypothetical protein